MPQPLLNQKAHALTLLGNPVRFAHQRLDGEIFYVRSVSWEGMVTLDSLPGEFAPFLFVSMVLAATAGDAS